MPTPTDTQRKPNYLLLAGAAVLLAIVTMLFFKFVFLPSVDRGAGGFGWDRLSILALAGVLFVDALFMAFGAYYLLFRREYNYLGECLAAEGNFYQNLTEELRTPLHGSAVPSDARLRLFTERREVAQFQFAIRCKRLKYSLLPLFVLLVVAVLVLLMAMLAAPSN